MGGSTTAATGLLKQASSKVLAQPFQALLWAPFSGSLVGAREECDSLDFFSLRPSQYTHELRKG